MTYKEDFMTKTQHTSAWNHAQKGVVKEGVALLAARAIEIHRSLQQLQLLGARRIAVIHEAQRVALPFGGDSRIDCFTVDVAIAVSAASTVVGVGANRAIVAAAVVAVVWSERPRKSYIRSAARRSYDGDC